MNLFLPVALGLVLLAAPIIWLFLRRPPVPTRAISSLLLARALAHIPQRPRRLPREELLPLALILGALLTMVVVLAFRPDGFDRPIVIVVDDSETSALHDEDAARLIVEAVEQLVHARPDAPVTVVGTAPLQIKVDASRSTRTILDALGPADPSRPGEDPTSWLPLLCGEGSATLVLIGPWHVPETAASCPVVRLEQPSPDTEVLTAVAASAPTSTGDIWLHVRATGQSGSAQVEQDGAAVGTVTLSEGESREGLARVSAPPGRSLTIRLDGTEHFAAASTIAIPPLKPAHTLVRTPYPDGYLATLARLHPRLRGVVVAPDAPAPTPDTPSGMWDLVLTDSGTPVTDDGRLVAVFGRAAPELGIPASRSERLPTVVESIPDHPVLKLVSLDTLHVEQATTLAAPSDARILATTAQGPVVVERPLSPERRAIVFGFGLDDTDLALRPDFVHLVANLVDAGAPPPAAPTPGPTRTVPTASPDPIAAPTGATFPWSWLLGLALALLGLEGAWLAARTTTGSA